MYQYEDHKLDDVRDSDLQREQEKGGPLAQVIREGLSGELACE